MVFICICIGNETPLVPMQLLWIYLILDPLASLALVTEPPDEDILKSAPIKRDESIINKTMWKHIISQSFIQILIFLILYLLIIVMNQCQENQTIGILYMVQNQTGQQKLN
jgi:magnesium-transporting ATPase (P-type)